MPRFFSSLFFKLTAVILVAGLGINFIVIVAFGSFRHHIASHYHPHLKRYVDYLLDDIGDPPDQDRARHIAAETGMVMTYEGKDQSWTTADGPITFPTDRMRIWHRSDCIQAGGFRGKLMIRVQLKQGRLTFLLAHQPAAEKKIKRLGICLLIVITAILIVAYLTIRWILKPLRWLKQGVDNVSRGELAHRVPLKSADELRDLSAAFNTMTERLHHLISSKEQLLLDVSHELRTPITRMKVALAMMPETEDRAGIEEDLNEMERKITQLLETARSLNTKAALNYQQVDVIALLDGIVQSFKVGRPAIEMTSMPASAVIRIDAELITQALKNIIDNSRKYSPDDALPIRISVKEEAEQLIIVVKDHGIGISPEDIDFIFEPFYRADKARTPEREGYGLGLSMAKNIMDAHGGDIVVESRLHQETVVRITLPGPVFTP